MRIVVSIIIINNVCNIIVFIIVIGIYYIYYYYYYPCVFYLSLHLFTLSSPYVAIIIVFVIIKRYCYRAIMVILTIMVILGSVESSLYESVTRKVLSGRKSFPQ